MEFLYLDENCLEKENITAGVMKSSSEFVCPSLLFGRVPLGRDLLSQGLYLKAPPPGSLNSEEACSQQVTLSFAELLSAQSID